MKHKIKHIHLVGIGGSGMSGIAEVLVSLGYQISGSDLAESTTTRRLSDLGVQVSIGHKEELIKGAQAIVVSTAVKEDNPEVLAAHRENIPVVPRAEMLSELMRFKQGIAVAGTHGKTTTTSLVASILAADGLDPTFVIGGRLNSIGSNACLGQGEYLVAEADESDASFLFLDPIVSVVTNIDVDHMETYEHDFERLHHAFFDFVQRLPFYGVAVLCLDDANVRNLASKISKQYIAYGCDMSRPLDVWAENIQADGTCMHFDVGRRDASRLKVKLNMPGMHNVLNALAAIAVATELQVKDAAIIKALREFEGVSRRFQHYGEVACNDGRFVLIDDYGHHPTEIAATISAVRAAYPERRLLLAFQPHRYSRTRDCFEDLVSALSGVDVLLLTEVYAAGETPLIAADARSLIRAIRVHGQVEPIFIENITDLAAGVTHHVEAGDVVLTMGAGNVGSVPSELVELCGGVLKSQ